ncbi:hypothetical protein BABINDRAFT_163095 [Babjeviella inositovora NRRL Y-12698]|uniref:C3H1-type domain-containing protein n=1 Tax=Babjeviella inositovora NRRL Y-12698 TaxID=984486 RepID=A0A1E3QKC4_9ASCO|nr:uncharacterized protein BABINDRAFT_163095 [Babjeviella inositovora NRRL Y-12698]ODQ78068.1 hypothetical protein BABINDRAFT_163095 [Babjeviella inositovora NRRL Y-12698]
MSLPQHIPNQSGESHSPIALPGLPTHLPKSNEQRTPSPGISLLQGYIDSDSGSDDEPPQENSTKEFAFAGTLDISVESLVPAQPKGEPVLIHGTNITLESEEDIAKWIEERKKRWPSRKRLTEKEDERVKQQEKTKEAAEKRQSEVVLDGPPAKRPQPQQRLCKFFLRNGKCQFGSKCKNKHVSPTELKQVRKTINGVAVVIPEKYSGATGKNNFFKNLIRKELETENEEVLDFIAVLGEKGML